MNFLLSTACYLATLTITSEEVIVEQTETTPAVEQELLALQEEAPAQAEEKDLPEEELLADLNFPSNSIIAPELSETALSIPTKEEAFPLKFFGAYENTGNIIAGKTRWLGGASYQNGDQEALYEFKTAGRASRSFSNALSYSAPVYANHIFKNSLTYQRNLPKTGDSDRPDFASMSKKGHEWEFASRYTVPFSDFLGFTHAVTAGYDFKRTNNFYTYSPALIYRKDIDVDQFVLSYKIGHKTDLTEVTMKLDNFVSPGNMTTYDKDENYDQERSGAKSRYAYAVPSADLLVHLPGNFAWTLFTKGQISTGALLPSEALKLGGAKTVRGYQEGEILSDSGALAKTEIHAPLLSFLNSKRYPDEFQFLVFSDLGYAHNVDPNIYTNNWALLSSVGAGFRYEIADYLNLRLDYGWQVRPITRADRPYASNDRYQLHFGSMLTF